MNIIKMLAPVRKNGARSGIKRTGLLGVTIHNTGNYDVGSGAKNHGTYLQNGGANKQASWHYVVDDKYIVQCVPEEEITWHAGDGAGKGNYQTISIEICVNKDGNILQATLNAIELAADILKRYGLPASSIFQHNHWSGKNCPAEIRKGNPFTWEMLCGKVAELMGTAVNRPQQEEKPTNSVYTGGSIVDYLKSIGVDSSFENRQKLAKQYGMSSYGGTATQNELLLDLMRSKVEVQKQETPTLSAIEQEAKREGMKVAASLPSGSHFWISENASIYGGASYGVKIPESIKKATTRYTSGGQREEHGCTWVLAKEVMSWVKVSECLIK